MFVAKFNIAKNSETKETFKEDKHQKMPYIGDVKAGTARGTLINGTIFERAGYKTDVLYLCENKIEMYEGKPQTRVDIICEVSPLDFMKFRQELGEGRTVIKAVEVENEAAKPE